MWFGTSATKEIVLETASPSVSPPSAPSAQTVPAPTPLSPAIQRGIKAAQRYLKTEAQRRFIDDAAAWLHGGSLDDALDFYQSIAKHSPGPGCLAALGLIDRYWLLYNLLGISGLLTTIEGEPRPKKAQDWLYARCREVERDPNGYLDLWAREHFKTTLGSFGGIIQEVLRDPDITVGIFSHTRGLAKHILRQIKQEFEQNARLKGLYEDVLWANPDRESPSWSEDNGIVVKRKRNPREATIEAWGLVDGQPTGKHFFLRNYDDVVTDKSVSPAMIPKTTAAWELSNNLGVEGGWERYFGTIYSFGDTYCEMMRRQAVKVRKRPATHDGTKTGDPVFWSQATWSQKKVSQAGTLAAQLLLNPAAGENAELVIAKLRSFFVRPRTLNVYIMGDPSKGGGKDSDNTAIAVIGVDSRGNRFLVDGVRHRMRLAERWNQLLRLYRKWKAADGVQNVSVGWEQFGLVTDIEYFNERMLAEKTVFSIKELNWPRTGPSAKAERIRRIEPDFTNGGLYVPAVVHDPIHGLSYWRATGQNIEIVPVDAAEDSDEMKKLRRKLNLPPDPPEWVEAIERGTPHLIQKPIKVIEHGDAPRVYDLTAAFIEEAQFFPFGNRDDLIDVVSRIYDMDIVPAPAPGQVAALNERPVYPD